MPVLTVRLSKAELAAIDAAASARSLPRSTYVRNTILPPPPPTTVDWDSFFARPRRTLGHGVAEEIRALQR